jgi:site-specific DNA recombinase
MIPSIPIAAALYARVSSDQQATAQTVASQASALQERSAADGSPVPPERTFIDDGYSGATLRRPALERLRDAIALGAVARLYVHSPDRLARKYAYQVLLVDEFRRAGVEVVFLNHAVGDNPEEELLLQVQGMIAEYERAKILERSRRGKRHRAQSGCVNVLSGAPYGYRYISRWEGGGEARYEIVPEQAQVVQQIFAWVGEERLSLGEVTRRLRARQVPTRTGKGWWDRTSVWGILKNPAYGGRAAFGKTRAGTPRPRLRPQRNKPAEPRRARGVYDTPPSEWIHMAVPAIVSDAQFAAAAEQLAENRRHARTRQRGARYLLQGLLNCTCCGHAFYGKAITLGAAKGKRRDYAYYRCIGTDAYRFGGERICPNRQVRTDRLETAVWTEVTALLQNPQRLLAEYERRLTAASTGPECAASAAVAAQIQRVRQGIGRLLDTYTDGYVEKADFEARVVHLKQRLAALEEQARQLEDVARQRAQLQLVVGRLEAFAAQVNDGLEHLDWSARRELVRTLVKRVDIGPEEVNVVFRVTPLSDPETPEEGRCLPLCRRRAAATARSRSIG